MPDEEQGRTGEEQTRSLISRAAGRHKNKDSRTSASRHQSKLARFEAQGYSGEDPSDWNIRDFVGHDEDPELSRVSERGGGDTSTATTPLLQGTGISSGIAKSLSRARPQKKDGNEDGIYSSTRHHGTRPDHRPYRYALYLSSESETRHARSLKELSIPGSRSLEDLFLGKPGTKNTTDMSSHDDMADSRTLDEDLDESKESNEDPIAAAVTMQKELMKNQKQKQQNGDDDVASSSSPQVPQGFSVSPEHPSALESPGSTPHGSPSQSLHLDETQVEPMPNLNGPIQDMSPVGSDERIWWLDVLCPTDAEMKYLAKLLQIHPLTTEDIQMEEPREKIELFKHYYFVCFGSFEQDTYSPTYLEPLNMYILVFRQGIVSFHFRPTPHPQNVRRRIKHLKDYINITPDWISYALIDDITDAFGPLIESIEYEVDSIDELVLILKEVEPSDMLRRIGTCRKKVMGLLRLMGNKADVVKGLIKRCNENWSVAPKSDIGLYLSDIQDHITTSTQNLTHYEKILSRSHSNYLAQISIEMTEANNQINDVLSKLTALGTVLIPMNLITGLWGMNVQVPGQNVENLDWFFGIVAVLIALALIGGYVTLKFFSH